MLTNADPSMALPFCRTCGHSVTLYEIEDNRHLGHQFDVAEAGALNVLRMFVNMPTLEPIDDNLPEPQNLPSIGMSAGVKAALSIAFFVIVFSAYLALNGWLKH